MEQNILEDLGFSLDLIYLASALGCQQQCSANSAPREVEELERMVEAVLSSADAD